MVNNDLATRIINPCFSIHSRLGPGLFESVYEEALAYELMKAGLSFERQRVIPLRYEALTIDAAFRADFIVEKEIIIELKSVEIIHPLHKKQVLSYLRLTGLELGIIVNFNSVLLRDGIVRVINTKR